MTAQAANARLTVRSAAIERGRLCPRPLYIDLSLIRNRPNANASDGPFLRFAKQMACSHILRIAGGSGSTPPKPLSFYGAAGRGEENLLSSPPDWR